MAIPAWKRLGLRLSSGAQSGDAVPGPNDPQDSKRSSESGDLRQSDGDRTQGEILPSVNGKSSSLGKRKHHHDAAEAGTQDSKRNRISGAPIASSGPVDDAEQVVAKVDNGRSDVPQPEVAEKPRPKGDPNYRQKKKKGPRQGPPAQNQSTSEPRRDPSISQDLLPSTEIVTITSTQLTTPKASKNWRNDSGSPPRTDRRKSVTFTPDTKTVDGNSAHTLFKKWVAEQKGAQDEFTATEAAQFIPPPTSHPANGIQPAKEDKIPKKNQKETVSVADAPKPQGKKKDPSLYLAYLAQFHNDNSNWKFNKAKQNDVLDNALNIFRIPDQHLEALLAYVKGLKGAGVVERLKSRCEAAIKELDEADSKMDDKEAQAVAEAEALEERLSKERKRRRTERDIESLRDHPYPEGFIRRLKRRRAEALLKALNLAIPLPPPSTPSAPSAPIQTAPDQAPPQRIPRKRKSRTEVSSDESSSSSSEDSSSEESSSEESDSDDSSSDDSSSEETSDDTGSESKSKRAGPSGSDSDSDSSSESDSSSNSESSSRSERESSDESSGDESD